MKNVIDELKKRRRSALREAKKQDAINSEHIRKYGMAVQVYKPYRLRGMADAYRVAIELIRREGVQA